MTPAAHRNRLDESARVKVFDDIRDRVRKKSGRVNWNATAEETANRRTFEQQNVEVKSLPSCSAPYFCLLLFDCSNVRRFAVSSLWAR
jgi:hypothetical protein